MLMPFVCEEKVQVQHFDFENEDLFQIIENKVKMFPTCDTRCFTHFNNTMLMQITTSVYYLGGCNRTPISSCGYVGMTNPWDSLR